MSKGNHDDNRLKSLIGKVEEPNPPPWLKNRIMEKITSPEPTLFQRVTGWFLRTQSLQFKPIGVTVALSLLLIAFWTGMQVERHTSEGFQDTLPALGKTDLKSAKANYLIGRGLLADNRLESAIQYFDRAVTLAPGNAELNHWRGIAYWALGDKETERRSYAKTLQKSPNFLPSLLYLGHNQFESGQYHAALESYERVLSHNPETPEALYNSALISLKLKKTDKAKQAFRRYLRSHRTGKWAYKAVDHLHRLGDFTYRTYQIGIYLVVANMSELLQLENPGQVNDEINYILQAFEKTMNKELHIVSYDKKDSTSAKKTALMLRRQINEIISPARRPTVHASWFGSAEILHFTDTEKAISPSVLIFTRQKNGNTRRQSI